MATVIEWFFRTLDGERQTLTIQANGDYTYAVNETDTAVQALRTPAQTLTDTFTYTMHDAANATSTSTITGILPV